jgi:hypothetical protein
MQNDYSGRVRRIWVRNVAGPVSAVCAVILPVAGLIFHADATVIVGMVAVPLLIAILLTWPAHHQVWKEDGGQQVVEERPKPQAFTKAVEEQPKPKTEEHPTPRAVEVVPKKPEINGELRGFRLSGNPGESRAGNSWRCYANAACKLYLTNSTAVNATLKELVIDGSALDPPAEFSQVTFIRGADKVLEQGMDVNCDVLLTYTFKGFQWKQLGRVDLKEVKVLVVDSLGYKHSISVPAGESLPTP